MAQSVDNLMPWTDPGVNNSIVSSTINYFGHGLLKQLADTKRHLLPYDAMRDINYQSFKARAKKLVDVNERNLYTTSVDFILNNADYLFTQPVVTTKKIEDHCKYGYKDKYKFLPPLEYYLYANEMNEEMKKMKAVQFYRDLARGDILVCRALAVGRGSKYQPMRVVSRDAGPHMLLIKNLLINVNLDIAQTRVPKIDEGSIPNTWIINTLVRVEVLSVRREVGDENAEVIVGTMGDTLVENNIEIGLGKLDRSELPEIINAVESYTKESVGSYDSNLLKMESFRNPRCVQFLSKQLKLSFKNTSLMSSLRGQFPESSCYKQLRRHQLMCWAHKHVADGVAHFKRGEHNEAFQLLNKALSIDPENVEAFVAKGALLGNMGNFEKAVEDFEKALKYNPEHGNARKYICETLLELGRRHEQEGKLGAAEKCFHRSLQVNASHQGSREAIEKLHARAGFKSSLSLDIKKEEDEQEVFEVEDDKPAVHVPARPAFNAAAAASSSRQSMEDSLMASNERFKNREKSLSPLAQKLAMQNNAWKPPDYIKTTQSYVQPPQTGTQSSVAVTTSGSGSIKQVVQETKKRKDSACVLPFVIGANKSAAAAAATAVATAPDGVIENIPPDLVANLKKVSAINIPATQANVAAVDSVVGSSLGEPKKVDAKTVPVVSSVGTKTTASARCISTSSSAPAVSSSETINTSASGGGGGGSGAASVAGKIMLDKNYENAMTVKPKNPDEIEVLSLTLIMLSRKYKSFGNIVRARLCLEKSKEHNPDHEPTLNALRELDARSSKNAPNVAGPDMPPHTVPAPQSAPPMPITGSIAYPIRPLMDVSMQRFSVPPPGFVGPARGPQPYQNVGYPSMPVSYGMPYGPPPNMAGLPPNMTGMLHNMAGIPQDMAGLPPNMSGLHSNMAEFPPNMAGPSPNVTGHPFGYGKWGSVMNEVPREAQFATQLSREDREYHEKVDSFLNKLMNRNKRLQSNSSSRSSSNSSSPDSSHKRPPSSGHRKSRSSRADRSRSPRHDRPSRPRNREREEKGIEVRQKASDRRGKSPDIRDRERHHSSGNRSSHNRDQPSKTRDEPSKTRDGPSQTRDGPSQTGDGPSQTRSGPSQTRDGPSQTRDGPFQTRDRPSQTQDGPSQTRDGPFQTRDRPTQNQDELSQNRDRGSKSRVSQEVNDELKIAKRADRSSEDDETGKPKTSSENRNKSRSKDVKKKRRRHRSSSASHSSSSSRSSSSNSHSSSAGSSISERIKRKKKKKKAKKQQKPPKISLKALGFSDDPQLQSLDKELLKKITKKIYQSNALLSDVKDSKKKRKKKSKESDSSDSDKDKPRKKKKTKDLLLKSIEKYLVKKKPEDIDETEPDCSLKSVEKYLVKKKDITQTEPDSTASSKEILQLSSKEDLIAKYVKKKDAPAEPILEENTEPDRSTQEDELLELAKKYVMNVNKRRADASIAPQNDATKSKNPEASNVKIERMMQLSDLEDLQKKLQNYYSKYQDKANEGPKSKKDVDTPALELTPSKYLVSKPKRESDSKSLELNPSKYLTPKLKPEEETSNLELKPAKYLIPQPKPEEKTSLELMPSKYLIKKNPDSKITSPPKSVIESNEMSETSLANKASQPLISSCKPALNSSVPSVFKSALQSVITQSKKEGEPLGPPPTQANKWFDKIDPTASAKKFDIPEPELPPKSGFKYSFQPVTSENITPTIISSLVNADGSILTPSEFRSGAKIIAEKKLQAVVNKAKNVAESISASYSSSSETPKRSKKRHLTKNKSRSPSKSVSRSPHSYSRSSSRSRRSQSRNRRSRSVSRGRRSRSISRGRRSRSRDRRRRSRSYGRRRRSRSPFIPQRRWNVGRYQRPDYRDYLHRSFIHDNDRRRNKRSRSRSNPRRDSSRSRSSSSESGSKRRNKVEKKDSKGNKDPMFGKWAADDCPDKTKSKPKDPEQVLKGMEKFLAESKEKKLQMIKERNIQFQKPPGD
ncbi:uncharacterized protein LOC108677575 [Hyalella azteca]|uniref:Uncharacterized protein LOC108677575 n=1 Tax=Hyalella azteca TaxID=294128 RepID=A0A8B7P819_HYAAZ|nr:uncharacterized protein LOC108677575 [Hyalella azteca]